MPRTYWLGGGTVFVVARPAPLRCAFRLAMRAARARFGRRREPRPHMSGAATKGKASAVPVDLATLPPMPTLVEGPQVQPDLIPGGDRAVFLVGTPEFQRQVLEPRLMPSSDPALALKHRLVKDRIYADRIAERARELGLPVIDVDGTRDLVDEVAELLQVEPEPIDLAAARRWENEVGAANLHAWLASPEAPNRELGPLPFACECGTPGCAERVELTLDEFFAGAVRSAH